MVTGKI